MDSEIKFSDPESCHVNTYTMALNCADVSLTSLPLGSICSLPEGTQVKTDNISNCEDEKQARLINETAVLLETPRGLVLSVADSAGGRTYSPISTTADDHTQQLIPVTLYTQCKQGGIDPEQQHHMFDRGSVPTDSEVVHICHQPGNMFDSNPINSENEIVTLCREPGQIFEIGIVSSDADNVHQTGHMFDSTLSTADSRGVQIDGKTSHLYSVDNVTCTLSESANITFTHGSSVLANNNELSSTTNEIKKRKGGWPKGKKRKIAKDIITPRAPMTGYVLYAIDRRQEIKESHPDMLFSDITKVLGQEWSAMPLDKKQKYLDEAEADKRRYIEELKTFHQSEAYHNYVRKKNGRGEGTQTVLNSNIYEGSVIDIGEDSLNELYCRVCQQYFTNLHNKKEHMFGKQHLQAITDELEKDMRSQQQPAETIAARPISIEIDMSSEALSHIADHDLGNDVLTISPPIDINNFIEEFLHKNYEREQEIKMLKRALKMTQESNFNLCKEIQDLKEYETKLDQDIKNMKRFNLAQSVQIDGLKMVPTLFGVIFN